MSMEKERAYSSHRKIFIWFSRSKDLKNTAAIQTCNDVNFTKAIQETCKQMEDDALEEQIEWMKKATLTSETDLKDAIHRLKEINNNLKFFKSSARRLMEKELINDVIAKNLPGKFKAEFIRNKGQKCLDLGDIIKII